MVEQWPPSELRRSITIWPIEDVDPRRHVRPGDILQFCGCEEHGGQHEEVIVLDVSSTGDGGYTIEFLADHSAN